ncbi:hypothetical protein CJD36_020510 [Flavipsychrobacter stenotrophus]|uniref:Uncharacterized protein n=2 Tax=Flavipsychrobacter stenotrophus TaxID=2077091 RepID=A0A2S7SQJ0_9BACT|nr:hypothetical protein CJD36_020510 [Flavipsychrobacter stenotrophus]
MPVITLAQAKQPKKLTKENTISRYIVRQVSIIDTSYTQHTFLSKLTPIDDTSLGEMLIRKVLNGKIDAYNKKEDHNLIPIDMREVRSLVAPRIDTVEVEDPVTGKIFTRVVKSDFHYETIWKYKLLEEWKYDRSTGTTDVKVTSIGLMKDGYGDDGSYHGAQVLLWLKYSDVADVLQKYYRSHPLANISTSLWTSYFTENYRDGSGTR